MIRICFSAVSAMVMALFLFSGELFSLPLTRTLYLVPGDSLELYAGMDLLFSGETVVRERFTAGAGLWNGASVSAEFDLLQRGASDSSVPGDSFLDFIFFIDSLSSGMVRTAWSCTLRFPSGPDAYIEDGYRCAAFGNNEIRTGPVAGFEISSCAMVFINCFYTFSQGGSGGFYGGFNLNPSDGETWKSLLGLNPFREGAFLYYENLKNDYLTFSCALIYAGFSPFLLFFEAGYTGGFSRLTGAADNPAIHGVAASLPLCAGLKFFIKESFYVEGYAMMNVLMNDEYLKWQSGFNFNLIF